MRDMKKNKDLGLDPQLTPSMHPSFTDREQSNITLFQSSPVERANNKMKAFMMFLKFL